MIVQSSRQKSCLREDGASLERYPRGALGTPSRFWIDRHLEPLIRAHCPERARVLDLGCHDGAYADLLLQADRTGSYLGVDIAASPDWARRAGTHGQLQVEFREYDAHKVGELTPGGFDFIFSVTTFEHFERDDLVLDGVAKQLVKGGRFLLVVPSEHSFWLYGRHGFRRYRARETRAALEARGLKIVAFEAAGGVASFAFHMGWFAATQSLALSGKALLGALAGGSRARAKRWFGPADAELNSTMFWHQKLGLGRELHAALNTAAAKADEHVKGLPALYAFVAERP